MNSPPQQPLARYLDDLSRYGEIAAVFLAGASGNDHRWELRSSAGELLALTKRVHSGGRFAKTYWKLVSATGMDAGNDIHLELRGADDRVLANIISTNDAPAVVTVTDDTGRQVARSTREKTLLLKVKHPDKLVVHDADDRVCAQIEMRRRQPVANTRRGRQRFSANCSRVSRDRRWLPAGTPGWIRNGRCRTPPTPEDST